MINVSAWTTRRAPRSPDHTSLRAERRPCWLQLRRLADFHGFSRGLVDQLSVTERFFELDADGVSAVVTAGSVVDCHGDSHCFRFLGSGDAILVRVACIDVEHERALTLQDGVDDPGIASATPAEQDRARSKDNGKPTATVRFAITAVYPLLA